MKDLLSNVGSGGGAPAVGAPAASGGGGAPAAADAPAEEKKKEEEKEESDDDMVSIFFWVFVIWRRYLSKVSGLWSLRLIYGAVLFCFHHHRLLLAFHTNALYFSLT